MSIRLQQHFISTSQFNKYKWIVKENPCFVIIKNFASTNLLIFFNAINEFIEGLKRKDISLLRTKKNRRKLDLYCKVEFRKNFSSLMNLEILVYLETAFQEKSQYCFPMHTFKINKLLHYIQKQFLFIYLYLYVLHAR